MPSVNSSSRPKVWPSSTFTTPSLPTFPIASESTSPTSRAKPDLYRVGEDVHAALERAPRILVELQLLVSHLFSLPPLGLGAGELAVSNDLGEHVRLSENQDFVGPELDLGPAVLAEDD